jgi:hypothetical protein
VNELALITPNEWQMMRQQAEALVRSTLLPSTVNTPEKAIAIMMLGRELGIGAWAALNNVNVIQGKPTVSPQLMLGLINRSEQLEDMAVNSTDQGCTVTMKRKGRTPHTETFDMKDAQSLGLTGKDNYKKQPATMMKWRAVAACARVVFPDVILGLYTPDEMGADVVTDDQGNMTVVSTPAKIVIEPEKVVDTSTGEIIEGTATVVTSPAPSKNVTTFTPNALYQAVMKDAALKAKHKITNLASLETVLASLKLADKISDLSTQEEVLNALKETA